MASNPGYLLKSFLLYCGANLGARIEPTTCRSQIQTTKTSFKWFEEISHIIWKEESYIHTSKKILSRCVSQLEKQYSRSVPKKFPGPFATLCQNTILFLLSFSPPSFNQAYLIGLVSNIKAILIVELQSILNPIKSGLFELLPTPGWGWSDLSLNTYTPVWADII